MKATTADKRSRNSDAGADLELIGSVAEEGGRIALKCLSDGRAANVQMKNGVSPVSDGDLAVDRFLRETLMAERPDYGWLSEETDDAVTARRHSAKRTFIVDPIDGTRAYIRGLRTWCVSVAVVEDGVPTAGVIVCPALETTYRSFAGGGAWKNRSRISVRRDNGLPVIAAPKALLPMIEAAVPAGFRHHPHIPSLAYRLALVAEGKLDATIVKPKAHDWDIAAAALILQEAGGALRTLDGLPIVLNREKVAKPALIAGRDSLIADMFGVVTADAFG